MNNIKIKDIIIVILAIALAFSVYCIIKENEAIADGIKAHAKVFGTKLTALQISTKNPGIR